MSPIANYSVITAMLAPALLMAATGSLLISANNRLARVVDRLRLLIVQWQGAPESDLPPLDRQIRRHRLRSRLVLRACLTLYLALSMFVATSLAMAFVAFWGNRIPGLPTALGLLGVLCLFLASVFLGMEVRLSVRGFDEEIDLDLSRRRS